MTSIIKLVNKIKLPLIALIFLLLLGKWLFKTESRETEAVSDIDMREERDRDFNSKDSMIIKERHIGLVKLDTIKALIAEIGWNDKVDVKIKSNEVSFLLESMQDKRAYQKIFFNNMGMGVLESRDFEDAPLFAIHDTEDEYGFTVRRFEKDEITYIEFPFEFLLGITDERDRQKASN